MGDRYDAEYMGGDDALYREKHVSRGMAALLGIPAVVSAGGAIAALTVPVIGAAVAGGVAALMAGAAAVYLSVMRLTVTEDELSVQYGTMGPRIPVANVTGTELVALDALTRIAVGVKWDGKEWRYIPPGVKDGVRVRFLDEGKEKTCLIGAEDAPALARAIAAARRGQRTGVRVAVSEETVGAAEEEVEVAADERQR